MRMKKFQSDRGLNHENAIRHFFPHVKKGCEGKVLICSNPLSLCKVRGGEHILLHEISQQT